MKRDWIGVLAKFDPDQPRDDHGRWSEGGGGATGGDGGRPTGGGTGGGEPGAGGVEWHQPTVDGRPVPIKVATVEEAIPLVLAGKVVEVPTEGEAFTLIERLAAEVNVMREAGNKAKDFDLCNVTVASSSLFCGDSLRSEEFPRGVPRLEMPQLGGKPVPGSRADTLPRNPWDQTEVDGAAAFTAHLKSIGIETSTDKVLASGLRASQRELVGTKVAKIINDRGFDPANNPIFISRDNYVVDGHHRWAAVVGRDLEDSHLGDLKMNVVRVDAPISEVLHLANAWSKDFGIRQVAGPGKSICLTCHWITALIKFNPDQERDDHGRWSSGGGSGGSAPAATEKPSAAPAETPPAAPAATAQSPYRDASKHTHVSDAAYSQIREAEQRISQHPDHETAFIADSLTGSKVFEKDGEKYSVHFTPDEMLMFAKQPGDMVFTHNHPDGYAFSADDLNLASRLNVAQIRATSPERTHVMTRVGAEWPHQDALMMADYSGIQELRLFGKQANIENSTKLTRYVASQFPKQLKYDIEEHGS